MIRELSLFTGAGGGLLGSLLLGFTPIGYVEIDDYCQRVIAQRIKDGILPEAPIFGDVNAFIGEGYAAIYSGLVDVLTAGFPCQPFSVAGKQRGAADERNMWPSTAECIGIVKPRFILLENVPGIRKYLPVVVKDLRRLGYEVERPLLLGADDVGGCCRRKRVFIVAFSNCRDGKEGVGPFENRTKQIQKGIDSAVLRPMWIQTIHRNAGSNNGMAYYLERGRSVGNGQVPRVVATAWRVLMGQRAQ